MAASTSTPGTISATALHHYAGLNLGIWRVEVLFEADDEKLKAAAVRAERILLAAEGWPGSPPEANVMAGEVASDSMTLEELLADLLTRRLHWSLATPTAPVIRLLGAGVQVTRVGNHPPL